MEADPDEELARERGRAKALASENLALRAGIAQLKGDLDRIAASRAWRWGHAITRLLGRLGGRRYRTEGAVRAASDRIAWLEATASSATAHGRRPELPDDPGHRWSFAIKISPPTADVAKVGGDLYFAEALARELRRRGHRPVVQLRPEWEDVGGAEHDVVIVLRGTKPYVPQPRHFNVLWSISHPDTMTAEECDRYDLVAVASAPFAARLAPQTATPVIVLEQATDAGRFFPEPRPEDRHELVFVANSRGVRRTIVADLLPTRHELAVYGRGWESLIDPRHIVAEHVANEHLRRIYSSAGVVLNDHWEDMRLEGYLSNRLYDAVACGAVVVSDAIDGLDRFDGAVIGYESPDELRALLDRLLAHPEERAERAAAGRARVLAGHTFAHRADALLDALRERLDASRDRSGRLRRTASAS